MFGPGCRLKRVQELKLTRFIVVRASFAGGKTARFAG
jgi:hypothetical protein